MEILDLPSPQIKDGKMARFCPSRRFILDFFWGGGGGFIVPFYFVQDCSLYTDASFPKKKMGERDFFFEERGGCTQAGVYWTWLLSAQCNGEQYPLANARMH